jgi:catechol 2,3-dioxygenase-like lactoylglutathione lyase family enzyme
MSTSPKVIGLVPMAHVADVQRSIDFYKLLGMELRGSLRSPSGELQWVHLSSEHADVMFTRASEPVIAKQQAVLFYLYADQLVKLRERLTANHVQVSEVTYPSYMPKGEIRVEDPDGYVLLIGQAG